MVMMQQLKGCRLPNRPTFHAVDRRVRKTGTYCSPFCGRLRNTELCTNRWCVRAIIETRATLRRILHELLLYACPYHLQRIQAVSSLHFRPRQECCQWFLRHCCDDPSFSWRRMLYKKGYTTFPYQTHLEWRKHTQYNAVHPSTAVLS
jgi:hypothetical protein